MSNIKYAIVIIICLALPCSAQLSKPSVPYAGGNSGASPSNGFIAPSAHYSGGNSGAAPNNGLFVPSSSYSGGNAGAAPTNGLSNFEQQENNISPTGGRVKKGAGGFIVED